MEVFSEKFKTKLSASGLVYKHYGRDVLCTLHESLRASPDELEWVYEKLYEDLMEGLDAIDNGIEIADAPRYTEGSGLATRVGRLNPRWNDAPGGPTEDERFEEASALCGAEFSSALSYIVESQLPARALVETAISARHTICPTGAILRFEQGGMPWKTHVYELERKHNMGDAIKFVLYTDQAAMWRVQAVTVEGTAFTNRLGLPQAWRGVRDEALCTASGIPGCCFCHMNGFIAGNKTYEGALAMARRALEL